MIKELIVTIALGALLGFGVTGGYYAISKKNTTTLNLTAVPTNSPNTQSAAVNNNSLSPTETPNLTTSDQTVTIESPYNNDIVNTAKITIKGTTTPKSHLIITTASSSFIGKSDNAGNFSIDITLDSGANLIDVESIDAADAQTNAELLVTYSTVKI